jgi:hypothetical protein
MTENRNIRKGWRGSVRLVTSCPVSETGHLDVQQLSSPNLLMIGEAVGKGVGKGKLIDASGCSWYWRYIPGKDFSGEVRLVTPQGLHADYGICEEGGMLGVVPEEVYTPIEEGIRRGDSQGKFEILDGPHEGRWEWDYDKYH